MNALQRDLKRLTARIEREDGPRVAADPWRQGFHLMPPVGWLNDPNGLCFWRGEYHVFYQYSPFNPAGGVKMWGHSVSRDLLHWRQCEPMLYPDQPYDLHGVYSGSALPAEDGLYLYYTGNVKLAGDYDYINAGREHNTCLAFTRDGEHLERKQLLMTNRDYPDGLTCHVRDPKVFAYEGRYYMVQGARTREDRGELLVFVSDDRVHWTHCNTITTDTPFGYMWECPDLFELDGQWFLLASPQGLEQDGLRYQNIYACGYFPLYGDFRGACTLGEFTEFDAGFDFYAPQTFWDGSRRLLIGWMGMPDAEYTNPTVVRGWQHCLTVPCELRAENGRLYRLPAGELTALREASRPVAGGDTVDCPNCGELVLEVTGDFRLVIRDSLVIEYGGNVLSMTFSQGGAGRDKRMLQADGLRKLRILIDRSSAELFTDDGRGAMTTRFYARPEDTRLTVCGNAAGTLYALREEGIPR